MSSRHSRAKKAPYIKQPHHYVAYCRQSVCPSGAQWPFWHWESGAILGPQ